MNNKEKNDLMSESIIKILRAALQHAIGEPLTEQRRKEIEAEMTKHLEKIHGQDIIIRRDDLDNVEISQWECKNIKLGRTDQ